MRSSTAPLSRAARKLLAELIADIGAERFDADCLRVEALMAERLREVPTSDGGVVLPGTPDIGGVEAFPVNDQPGRRVVAVELWASQAACDAVGHLVSCQVWYTMENTRWSCAIAGVAMDG